MDTLHNALLEGLSNRLYEEGTEIICAKLEDQGIVLTSREREKLIRQLKSGSGDGFQGWTWWESQKETLTIEESDLERLQERFDEFLDQRLPNIVRSVTEELAVSALDKLHKRWKSSSRRQARELSDFRKALRRRWGPALERLRMFLSLSRELGESATNTIREKIGASFPNIVNILPRLHARACQITGEIICLLDSGFSDGAMARWRTLHEVASVAIFLVPPLNEQELDSSESLATRYIDHDFIESFKAASDYKSCFEKIGYEPMEGSEYDKLREAYDRMIGEYGNAFKGQYGWASESLGKSRPTFRDIEEAAGLTHLRAHYRMASHNVHANPKGVFFKLGLLGERDILLAGPSGMGLADPGHSAAVSLLHVTAALCSLEPNLDFAVGTKVLGRLVDEIGELFIVGQDTEPLVNRLPAPSCQEE